MLRPRRWASMGTNLDAGSEQFFDAGLGSAGESETRLRAERPLAFREQPSACLNVAGRPLQLLALRLNLPRYLQKAPTLRPVPAPSAAPNQTNTPQLRRETTVKAGSAALATLGEVEREHILQALEQANGNKAKAARLLGVSRHQLYSKLERLGLPVSA